MSTATCERVIPTPDRPDEIVQVSPQDGLPHFLPFVQNGTCTYGKGDCANEKTWDVWGKQKSQ